jgi:hypothetical protein
LHVSRSFYLEDSDIAGCPPGVQRLIVGFQFHGTSIAPNSQNKTGVSVELISNGLIEILVGQILFGLKVSENGILAQILWKFFAPCFTFA